jgi:hypothetical protein
MLVGLVAFCVHLWGAAAELSLRAVTRADGLSFHDALTGDSVASMGFDGTTSKLQFRVDHSGSTGRVEVDREGTLEANRVRRPLFLLRMSPSCCAAP